jgi:hypothetical protein
MGTASADAFIDVDASFANEAEGYNPVAGAPTNESYLPQVRPEMAPAVDLTGTGIEGETRSTDISIPKLALVNGLSKARQEGDKPLGAFVFTEDWITIAAPADKKATVSSVIDCAVLNVKKGYQKYIPYGQEEEMIRAASMEEVRAMGGTLNRKDKSRVLFEETAQLLLLFAAPEGLDENELAYFRFEHNGQRFARGMFFVKSIAYTNVFKPIASRVNNTGEPVTAVSWGLHSKLVATEKFSYWTPMLKATRTLDPEFRKFAESKKIA